MKLVVIMLIVSGLFIFSATHAAEPQLEEAAADAQDGAVADSASETSQNSSKTAEKSEKKKDDKSKVICKSMPVTGSRRVHRVCHTAEEWKAMETAAKETMRDIESQPMGLRF